MRWLYEVPVGSGRRETVEYTVWSDVFRCPKCSSELLYWTAARRDAAGPVSDLVRCRECNGEFEKRTLTWIGERAVETNVSRDGESTRDVHPPTATELAIIEAANAAPLLHWVPDVPFDDTREMWRAGHRAAGITSVAQFYTRRNLYALAALRHHILEVADERLRDALLFAFTAAVNRASKRYQWNAKRPTNVMTGTLYVSSLRYEWNVWSLFGRKVRDVIRYFEHLGNPTGKCSTVLASAARLAHIPDETIDLVFMDPPFGSNIFYADSSLLWEAWLGRLTNQHEEMVVHKKRPQSAGGKTLEDYGKLMCDAFAEVRRVLKPSSFAVLVFNNTDDSIWNQLQHAIADAGLRVVGTSALDKVHPSIKGVKGLQGKEAIASFDAVISLQRASTTVAVRSRASDEELFVRIKEIVGRRLSESPRDALQRQDLLFSVVIRTLVEEGVSCSGVTMELVNRAVAAALGQGLITHADQRGRLARYTPVGSPHGCIADEYVGTVAEIVDSKNRSRAKSVEKPDVREVRGERNTALYNAHSYHTKVPPEAIVPFIEHFTRPGDVVLDPFSGSGMTGVAAALSGRRAVLNDLSVAAAHLGFNHTRPCDPVRLKDEFDALYARLRPRIGELYRTTDSDGTTGYIHYTLWSRRYGCGDCGHEFAMWDVVDQDAGRVGSTLECPGCRRTIPKRKFRTLGDAPVLVNYEAPDGKRLSRPVTSQDLDFIASFKRDQVAAWYPDVAISSKREMYIRSALQLQNIASVADFYTPRNLAALAGIWEEVHRVSDRRIRQVLAFAFTNTAWHGTKMRRFNARGGQRPLTGTLYIPQLSSEANVLEVMRHKIDQLCSYYKAFDSKAPVPPVIRIGTATDLSDVPSKSIDYVFTDPPFGSNLFYADCNLIWESWLGGTTLIEHEAVVNRSLQPVHGGKTLDDYQRLMTQSLAEMRRVLKDGGWTTLVFHNTDDRVWQALQDAAIAGGFEIQQAANLNRKQQSHKGYKGRAEKERVAHFDVIVSMRKLSSRHVAKQRSAASEDVIAAIVTDLRREMSAVDFTVQRVHSAVIRRLANDGYDLGSVTYDMIKSLIAQHRDRPLA